jgi:D-alanine-D-alanine ligase
MGERRTRVAVVFGGRSSEHTISCVSAGSVLAHLDRDRFDVVPVGITPDGAWVLGTDDPARLRIDGRTLPVVDGTGAALALPGDPTRGGLVRLDRDRAGEVFSGVDVVFPVLHGPFGEDGTIQGLFEMAGLPYVGSGVLASAAGMDKEFTKKLLAAEGLAVGSLVVLRPGTQSLTAAQQERLGLPVFVKPARAGSSVGITRVTSWDRLDEAVAAARVHDPKVLVEAAIVGREVECGVLEYPDGTVRASLPAEIRLVSGSAEFYDFDAKYPTTPASSTSRPSSTTTPPRGCAPPRSTPSAPSTARAWPASTSSSTTRARRSSTRSTRCPGSPRSRCTRGCGRRPVWTTRRC